MTGNTISYETIRNFYCDKEWMMDRIDQWEWDMKMLKNKSPFAAIQYIRKSIGYDEFLKEYAAYREIGADELFLSWRKFSSQPGNIRQWRHGLLI